MSSEPSPHTPVLIVGAGPTGLVLALSLARRGIAFRIIDSARGPGEQSRAMVVQARTLEFYRQFGLADEVVEAGVKVEAAHLRESRGERGNEEVLKVAFTELGKGQSPYPFLLAYPQDDHERWLVEKLQALGVTMEWSTRLEGFTQDNQVTQAHLVHEAVAPRRCGWTTSVAAMACTAWCARRSGWVSPVVPTGSSTTSPT